MTTTATSLTQETLTGDYTLDLAHTRIGFSARHVMVSKVRGQFNEFNGSLSLDAEQPANSKVELTIKAASIDTRNADRDAHLRSNDFFAMEEYPEITFRSTRVEQASENEYYVTGDLTIRGTTKPVTVNFQLNGSIVDPWGNFRVGFDGKTTINRKDWGVSFNAPLEAGGVMVSEKVELEFEVEAVKVKPAA
ncbi:MAG TPA: YceI family protein [Acidimicrobiales bacterium]|nr:YceI family protein [Acidimicrobiales bacterium]